MFWEDALLYASITLASSLFAGIRRAAVATKWRALFLQGTQTCWLKPILGRLRFAIAQAYFFGQRSTRAANMAVAGTRKNAERRLRRTRELRGERQEVGGLSHLSVKLWVPTAEDVLQIDAAELSPGEFAYLVRHSVEQDKARVIVIDSLNGYMNAMPEEQSLTAHLHEPLLTYLGRQGVATFMVVAQSLSKKSAGGSTLQVWRA